MTEYSLTGHPGSVGELVARRWHGQGVKKGAALESGICEALAQGVKDGRAALESEIYEALADGENHCGGHCDACVILRTIHREFSLRREAA